jgi:CheY-like chemotaxis protein
MLMTSAHDRAFDPAIPVAVKPLSPAIIEKIDRLLAEARSTAEALRTSFEWNRSARVDLKTAQQALRETFRRSRRRRCDYFCSRLREPGARIPTILLVEDDTGLRYALSHFLAGRGFRVLDAGDGARALQLSRDHDGAIDLVLTDLEMPGLDGLSMLDAIEAQRPGVSTLVMTASDTSLPRQMLRKPFEFDDLLAEVVGVFRRW